MWLNEFQGRFRVRDVVELRELLARRHMERYDVLKCRTVLEQPLQGPASEGTGDQVVRPPASAGANVFWLSNPEVPESLLLLFVRGGCATMIFHSEDSTRSLIPTRGGRGLPRDGETIFAGDQNVGGDLKVRNDAVIDVPTAVAAACEFFATRKRPSVVAWIRRPRESRVVHKRWRASR